jgi:diguanylate cyclase (GGDEF)-like protein
LALPDPAAEDYPAVVSPWISVLVAALMAAFGVFVGFRLGRRAGGPSGNAPRLPSDLEHLLDLLRRSHRAIAAVLCGADGQLVGSTHPRGVPRSVVERAMATARLALANDGPELLPDPPAVVAAAYDGVAIGLVFDGSLSGEQVERVRADVWRLAAGVAASRRTSGERTQSRWSAESWLEIPETIEAASATLSTTVGRAVGRPVALVLKDELRGVLRVARTAHGADQRLEGTSALPGSAVARTIGLGAPVAATSPEELFGHPRADRRRAERQGLVFPILDGRIAIGALVVFGPPASLAPEVRGDVERILGLAAPRLSHLQALHVQETRARTDELTGLPNRRGLQEAMATWSGHHAALLILDVDHFKLLNDTFGHVAGDAALRHLALVLGRALRDSDIAARIGGEEFALWLPDTPVEASLEVAERVRAAIEQTPVAWQGRTIPFTCSIGVATLPGSTPEKQNLYATADAALYRAKQGGRNRVEVAPPDGDRLAMGQAG